MILSGETVSENNIIVQCSKCGAKNRIPLNRIKDNPICGKCQEVLLLGDISDRPVDITDRTFDEQVLRNPGPVLVDCWAPWCSPCRMIAPILEQLAKEYVGRIKIAKLNVDENPLISSQYNVRSIPTMLIFKNGKLADTLVGALPKQDIEKRLINQL